MYVEALVKRRRDLASGLLEIRTVDECGAVRLNREKAASKVG
jgi:hypothetical protein